MRKLPVVSITVKFCSLLSNAEAAPRRYLEAGTPVGKARGVAIRGLIFDFDGLILDTETTEFQAWQEAFAEHNCVLEMEHWATGIGKGEDQNPFSPYDHLETLYGKPIDRHAVRKKRHRRHMDLIALEVARPGVLDYLETAKRLGLRLAVASSSPREWVVGHLSTLGFAAQFDCIRCSDDVTHTKPHPELYLAALDALGLRPEEAIAFEDSPFGVSAAKAAGLFCVAVPNSITCRLPLEHADLRLNSLAEMPLEALIAYVVQPRK